MTTSFMPSHCKSLKSFQSLKKEKVVRGEPSRYLKILVQRPFPLILIIFGNEELGSVSSFPIKIREYSLTNTIKLYYNGKVLRLEFQPLKSDIKCEGSHF